MKKLRICRKRALQRLSDFLQRKGARSAHRAPSEEKSRLEPIQKQLSAVQAAPSLVDESTVNSTFYRNKQLFAPWEGSHPKIVEFSKRLCKELERRKYPFYAFEFHRSDARQNELLKAGRTRAKAGQSPHNWGCAVDIIHVKRLWNLTPNEWAIIGAIGKEVARKMGLKVVWGGDWSFYDPAHWEFEDWREYRAAHLALVAGGEPHPRADDDQTYFHRLDKEVKARKRA